MLSSTCHAVICPPSAGKTAAGAAPPDRPRAFCRALTDVETVCRRGRTRRETECRRESHENIFNSSRITYIRSHAATQRRLINTGRGPPSFLFLPACNARLSSLESITRPLFIDYSPSVLSVRICPRCLPLSLPRKSFALRNKFGRNSSVNGPLFQVDLHFTLNELHIALLTQICERAACASRIPISDRPSVISGNFQKSPRTSIKPS